MDVFAADLTTEKVRLLTSHLEYVGLFDIFPYDKWSVAMGNRGSNRQMFLSGMRGMPLITDMITAAVSSSTRDNGRRRSFSPWLIDRYRSRLVIWLKTPMLRVMDRRAGAVSIILSGMDERIRNGRMLGR